MAWSACGGVQSQSKRPTPPLLLVEEHPFLLVEKRFGRDINFFVHPVPERVFRVRFVLTASAESSSRQQQLGTSTSLDGEDASHGANADTTNPSEALRTAHDDVGMKSPTAEERESSLVTSAARTAEHTDQDVHMKAEPAASTKPLAVLPPALRRATEGREGVEDRSSHLMDCCFCQDSLPEGESIGRCDTCPRSFCTQCLEHSLLEGGVDLEAVDRGSRAMLEGKDGDFFIAQCPRCISGCDTNFSPPHGVPPMEHLLNELLRHDLSICFREPVDIIKHPDYIEAIGRDSMMDLGTMLSKLKGKKYPRRRGPGQFMEDLNRIWRNCRKFAGCDELGKPHYGTTVPGIVRCALTLEAMQRKFCAAHPVADNQGQAWQVRKPLFAVVLVLILLSGMATVEFNWRDDSIQYWFALSVDCPTYATHFSLMRARSNPLLSCRRVYCVYALLN